MGVAEGHHSGLNPDDAVSPQDTKALPEGLDISAFRATRRPAGQNGTSPEQIQEGFAFRGLFVPWW